jgi:hypothetical protein
MRRNIFTLRLALRLGAIAAAATLAACSAGPVIDNVPTEMGGLPAGAPKRPATQEAYPAVHDMPPPRESEPLSIADQLKVETELTNARQNLEKIQDRASRERVEAANANSTAAKEKNRAAAQKRRPPAASQ